MKPERWSELRERVEGAVTPEGRAFLRRFSKGVCVSAAIAFGGLTVWALYAGLFEAAVLFAALTAAPGLPLLAWAADARRERQERAGRR